MILTPLIVYVINRKLNVSKASYKLLVSIIVSLLISGVSSIPVLPVFASYLLPEWYALPFSFPFYFTLTRSPLTIYPPIFILRFYFIGLPLYIIHGQWLSYIPQIILYAFIPFLCINLVSSLSVLLLKTEESQKNLGR